MGGYNVLSLANNILLITYTFKSLLSNLLPVPSQAVLISNKGKKTVKYYGTLSKRVRKVEVKIRPIISIKCFYLF